MHITIDFPGGMVVQAQLGRHTLQTDQPRDMGGDDTAPSPFQLFLASIGTCAGFYVLRFCQQRGIAMEGIRLRQYATADAESHMVRQVTLLLELPESFPERYRTAVLRAIEQCTVKKHLEHPPEIAIEVQISSL